jgi:hypothetical protein
LAGVPEKNIKAIYIKDSGAIRQEMGAALWLWCTIWYTSKLYYGMNGCPPLPTTKERI